MRVTRYMSKAEWDAYQQGKILLNYTDHFEGGRGGSISVGFCFTADEPNVAWEYLKGIVDADVWATFEFPDGYLTESKGVYADYSEDAGFFAKILKREWCCKSYDLTIAKVVDYCDPFQGEEYRKIKSIIKKLKIK